MDLPSQQSQVDLNLQEHDSSVAPTDRLLNEMGFDLSQVTWGYQEVFRRAIRELHANGLLGPKNRAVTDAFFEILGRSDKSTLDSVLRSFLESLRGEFRWLMRLPRLFERWARTGLRLGEHRHFLGMRFFEQVGKGTLGTTPAELEFVLDVVGLLIEENADLVGPFLRGYPYLSSRLSPDGIRSFVLAAVRVCGRDSRAARAYLACELESAIRRIDQLTRQASILREEGALERLVQALLGRSVEVRSLGVLDADDLQLRGSSYVACPAGLYLPERLTEFGDHQANLGALKALICLGIAALQARSFAAIHGLPGTETVRDIVPVEITEGEAFSALVYIVEVRRVLAFARCRYPGLGTWLARFVSLESAANPVGTGLDALLLGELGYAEDRQEWQILREIVEEIVSASESVVDTVGQLTARWEQIQPVLSVTTCNRLPRPLFFFPDPFFPLTITAQSGDQAIVDLRDALRCGGPSEESDPESDERDRASQDEAEAPRDGQANDERTPDTQAALIGYFYDEWNVHCCDYYRDWCCVHEKRPTSNSDLTAFSSDLLGYADQVRRVFESLRPQEAREETRLLDGDSIGFDAFMEYVSQRDVKPNTEMRFYSKPLVRTRDVAVCVLIDLSGSTAEPCEELSASPLAKREGKRAGRFGIADFRPGGVGKTVVEVEKEAAFVLATGLAALGDTFAVSGFTGTGRENCQFVVIKAFEDDWTQSSVRQLLGASPGASTRIGAALRHAGWRMGDVTARTKVLLLITDGKPCDQGYDTANHYAQHDVRKACEENAAAGIHTFCVSTSENTPADMEIMFPRGRYLILSDISRLPGTLSRLYLQLTR
jgi:hypothetical protein